MPATAEARRAILCVDDEAVILLALGQELRRRFGDRFSIETALGASQAFAAIERLEAEGIDVAIVVCDWYMPRMQGDEFLAKLRAQRPQIKSVLMTGQADKAAIARAKEAAGITACVTKPWRPELLARAIEACLGGIG